MFVAFLESFKYVGHLFPLVLLRTFIGWYYLKQAMIKYSGEFLYKPLLSHHISEWLPKTDAPVEYKAFIEEFVIPHPNWVFFAYAITGIEFLVGFSFLSGFLVRPTALIAAFLSFNMAMLSGPTQEPFLLLLFVTHISMAWIGGGRCLGVDYYFYKRRRGFWW